MDRHDAAKAIGGARRQPLERRRLPGIGAGLAPAAAVAHEVDDEHQHAGREDEREHRGDQVQRVPAQVAGIGVDAPRHAEQPGQVHRQEGDVEADEHQPEGPAPEPLREHAPGARAASSSTARRRAGTPCRRSARSGSARRRSRCRAPASRTAPPPPSRRSGRRCAKMNRKPRTNSIGTRSMRLAVPQRRDPGEDLDAHRDRDRGARRREERERHQRQAGREHVVHPQPEAEEADRRPPPGRPTRSRPAACARSVGSIIDTMPAAGRKMM